MFPIYILKEGAKLPENGTYYVVAGNGTFIRKDTGLITALVKVPQISFLEEVEPWAQQRFPKIPREVIARAVDFFNKVYQKFGTEAILLLYYSKNEKRFELFCPAQTVEELGIEEYEKDFRFSNFQLVGTIHSHGWLEAFYSGTDDDDDDGLDGLHVTLGSMDTPHFSISCSLAVNGNRFMIEPEKMIEGIQKTDWVKPKKQAADETFKNIPICLNEDLAKIFGDREIIFEKKMIGKKRSLKAVAEKTQYYCFDQELSIACPAEWIKMVRVKREQDDTMQIVRGLATAGLPVRMASLKEARLRPLCDSGLRRGKEEKNEIAQHKSGGSGRHWLLSFALFGQIFTVSVGEKCPADAH